MTVSEYYECKEKYGDRIITAMNEIRGCSVPFSMNEAHIFLKAWDSVYQIAENIELKYDVECLFNEHGRILLKDKTIKQLPFEDLGEEICTNFKIQIKSVVNMLHECNGRPLNDINKFYKRKIEDTLWAVARISKTDINISRDFHVRLDTPGYQIRYKIVAQRRGAICPIDYIIFTTLDRPQGYEYEELTFK